MNFEGISISSEELQKLFKIYSKVRQKFFEIFGVVFLTIHHGSDLIHRKIESYTTVLKKLLKYFWINFEQLLKNLTGMLFESCLKYLQNSLQITFEPKNFWSTSWDQLCCIHSEHWILAPSVHLWWDIFEIIAFFSTILPSVFNEKHILCSQCPPALLISFICFKQDCLQEKMNKSLNGFTFLNSM